MLDGRIVRRHAGEAEATRLPFDAYEPGSAVHRDERDLSGPKRLRAFENEDVSGPDPFVLEAAVFHAIGDGGRGTRREEVRKRDGIGIEVIGRPGEGHRAGGEGLIHYGVRSLTMQGADEHDDL